MLQLTKLNFNSKTHNNNIKYTKKNLNNIRISRKSKKLNLTNKNNLDINDSFNCTLLFTKSN
jgi:hypothetical protein